MSRFLGISLGLIKICISGHFAVCSLEVGGLSHVIKTQQVEVAPSLVTDCKKPLHQNRWFWGLGIGFFKSDENLRATFQNYFGERAL